VIGADNVCDARSTRVAVGCPKMSDQTTSVASPPAAIASSDNGCSASSSRASVIAPVAGSMKRKTMRARAASVQATTYCIPSKTTRGATSFHEGDAARNSIPRPSSERPSSVTRVAKTPSISRQTTR
jgi:hypothetical protein